MGPASWSVTGGPGQSSDPVANREGGGGRDPREVSAYSGPIRIGCW